MKFMQISKLQNHIVHLYAHAQKLLRLSFRSEFLTPLLDSATLISYVERTLWRWMGIYQHYLAILSLRTMQKLLSKLTVKIIMTSSIESATPISYILVSPNVSQFLKLLKKDHAVSVTGSALYRSY